MWQNKKYIEQANKIGSKVINKKQETSIFRFARTFTGSTQQWQNLSPYVPKEREREIHTHKHMCSAWICYALHTNRANRSLFMIQR